ncbi:MAG: S41 family peptidase [Cytophagales bacterium]|nr:S41 family peptidase [Cytophagales bacterium]
MKNSTFRKAFIAFVLVVSAGLFAFEGTPLETSKRYFDIARNLDIFATLFREVNTYYVDDVNPNDLMKTGIDAMLESLDPYTNYIPEDDIEDYRTMTTGEYGGIGAVIGRKNGKNVIIMPYEGFPAAKAGLHIADEILKVDGQDVQKKNTSDISKLLKGQANTSLTITIRRYPDEKPKEFSLERKKITLKNVPYFGMVKDDVGYIKLTDFTRGAGKEVKNALKELKGEGARKVILDLRGNPGGLLSEAVNVSNVFIHKGKEVVSTKGKVTEWNKSYKTLNSAVDEHMPMVVLINGRSASASEIVSGVMQDYDRGVLVGMKSFGKGLVQTTRPLSYNSQLKVTTAKYYIPSGRCIQALDYSHKDANGKATKLPDSLKVAYKTKSGRTVYDGAGIDPDVKVEHEKLASITRSLVGRGYVFDYATQFHSKHSAIAPAKDFQLSDAEYAQFVKWLQGKDYEYETDTEKLFEKLVGVSKKEINDEKLQQQLLALKEEIVHDKKGDLQSQKGQILQALNQEIASRYYLSDGLVEVSFRYDPDIKKAVELLDDEGEYRKLLSVQ